MKLFRAEEMKYTPFARIEDAGRIGVAYTDNPLEADIIISRKPAALLPYARFSKKLVIWTHEPRYSMAFSSPTVLDGIHDPVFVMNAYTGQIYTDPFYYFPHTTLDFDDCMAKHRTKPSRVIMLATCREGTTAVLRDGIDLDLAKKRQALARTLQSRASCDIFGRNWPSSVRVTGESRGDGWRAAKRRILEGYSINVAYENTLIPYYLTEKLWEAVIGGCLPVYHATDGVYEVFPKGSFVDGAGKSPEAIADEVNAMTPALRTERYESCLRAYAKVNSKATGRNSKRAVIERTREFLGKVIESR